MFGLFSRNKLPPWTECSLLVIDLETTSLDPRQGSILSIGMVAIDHAEVRLNSACELRISGNGEVGDSATIHGLRDVDCSNGMALTEALTRLQQALDDRIPVFHHAGLDRGFLNAAARSLDLPCLPKHFIDTLAIERRRLERQNTPIAPDDLLLSSCRRRAGLPDMPAHQSIHDAMATAELALVQFARADPGGKQSLTSFL